MFSVKTHFRSLEFEGLSQGVFDDASNSKRTSYHEFDNLRSGVPYIFCPGGKVRLIQLLDYSSVASPESGLFSDWSRNKTKVLRTKP